MTPVSPCDLVSRSTEREHYLTPVLLSKFKTSSRLELCGGTSKIPPQTKAFVSGVVNGGLADGRRVVMSYPVLVNLLGLLVNKKKSRNIVIK